MFEAFADFLLAKIGSSTECACEACQSKEQLLAIRQRKKLFESARIRSYVALVIGWGIVVYMAYWIATVKVENTIWDPYDVLGISPLSSVAEIKSHYKNLSRMLHPDKIRLVGNMTKDAIESRFVDVTKAYKAYVA